MVKKISDLNHIFLKLKKGGEIIALDNGAVIDAEAEAMLQALHSRSTGGLKSHLKVLAEKGADNFMANFYVGYGHKSIGDCGTTTLFIEGVSMLAAKAIQDFQLYNGQEASTRYVDFAKQHLIDPTETKEGKELLEIQRQFYINAQEPTREYLMKLYPLGIGEEEKVYKKAITARAFDITRSLLPAGASTNLAWHTNLRQAADRMLFLRHHPLSEVRGIGEGLEEILKKKYSNSFVHKKYTGTELYQEFIAGEYFYHDPNSPLIPEIDFKNINLEKMAKCEEFFSKRPQKTELPKFLSQLGTMEVKFQIDFGSFRDIQRHRSLNQRMPLLTTELGFNKWYAENLPEVIRDKLLGHLQLINGGINNLKVSKEDAQYFLPMGYNTSNRFTGDLPAVVYVVELRDTRFVHPTLQKVAHEIGRQIKETLKIKLYVDEEPSRFDIRRGSQDINLK